jgi:hypothetical protein
VKLVCRPRRIGLPAIGVSYDLKLGRPTTTPAAGQQREKMLDRRSTSLGDELGTICARHLDQPPAADDQVIG